MSIRKTADIFISDSLREILEEISESSIIAKMLLKKRHYKEDLKEENPINYLSISGEDNLKISYLNHDRFMKLTEKNEDIWTSSIRFHARPGSVVNKIFKNLNDRDVDNFITLYRSALNRTKFNFRVVDGEDIRYYYHIENYQRESHSLGNSCMKYDSCQRYFGIYMDNPEIVKMLIMVDDNDKLMGRALLWTFDDYKVMDRIYTVNDDELPYQFKKWASDNGYMYKYEQKWNNTHFFELGGKKVEKKFAIQLKSWKYDRYPYFDTFKFLDTRNGILHNYLPDNKDNLKTVCAPDGGYYQSDFLGYDFISGLYHNRGEMVTIRYREDGTLIENSNSMTHSSNVEWSNVNDMYILKRDAKYDDDVDDFIFNEKLDSLNNKPLIEERKAQEVERRKKEEKMRLEGRDFFNTILRGHRDFADIVLRYDQYVQEVSGITQIVSEMTEEISSQPEPAAVPIAVCSEEDDALSIVDLD